VRALSCDMMFSSAVVADEILVSDRRAARDRVGTGLFPAPPGTQRFAPPAPLTPPEPRFPIDSSLTHLKGDPMAATTPMMIRVQANGGKFLADDIGGAEVTVRDARRTPASSKGRSR
jgi:hypothetical protein